MSFICRGCGTVSEDQVCTQCLPFEINWNKCQTCHLSCPLTWCVPCRIDFKKNRKCEGCDNISLLRYCPECFAKLKTQFVCYGCARFTLNENKICDDCFSHEWLNCELCDLPTPLKNFCIQCKPYFCSECGIRSENNSCNCYLSQAMEV